MPQSETSIGAQASFSRLEFLRFGFVVDPGSAEQYLSGLVHPLVYGWDPSAVTDRPDRFKEILCSIVQELTFDRGHKEVGISLSAGLDSRALLGALLEIYNPRDIHALTYGAVSHPDRIGAEKLQRKVGFSHTVVDFDDFTWRAHDLEQRVGRQYSKSGMLDSIGSVQTYAVRSKCLGDLPILQGYLGDALSMPQHRTPTFSFGNVASAEAFRRDIDEFLATNDAMGRPMHMMEDLAEMLGRTRSKLMAYLQKCSRFLDEFRGLSTYDLLNLGFRQGLRIRPDTEFMPNTLLPFEHPEFVGYWLGQPLVHRSDKSHYRQRVCESFPHLFKDLREAGLPRFLASHMTAVGKKALYRFGIGTPQNKGDPRGNEELRRLMLSLAKSFDARGVVGYGVVSELERWLRRGDRAAASRVKWAVSLELHIRAGNL